MIEELKSQKLAINEDRVRLEKERKEFTEAVLKLAKERAVFEVSGVPRHLPHWIRSVKWKWTKKNDKGSEHSMFYGKCQVHRIGYEKCPAHHWAALPKIWCRHLKQCRSFQTRHLLVQLRIELLAKSHLTKKIKIEAMIFYSLLYAHNLFHFGELWSFELELLLLLLEIPLLCILNLTIEPVNLKLVFIGLSLIHVEFRCHGLNTNDERGIQQRLIRTFSWFVLSLSVCW